MRMMLLNRRGNNYETRRMGGYDRYNETENRFRDRRGREHYDNGRYAPMRNEYTGGYEDEYTSGYENRPRGMNTIGFTARGNRYEMRMGRGMRGEYEMGGASGMEDGFTEEDAEEWVHSMKSADGSSGEHWSMQQVKQLINQRRLDLDPVELYIALNATYSDLSKFFKKYNINNMDAYIDFAKMFWLEDEDAVEDKLAAYYMYVVK